MSTVIFDLEWNTGFVDGTSFDEIIEIGAVRVDQSYNKTASFQRLIRPAIYRKMNPYIKKIISITMDDLKSAEPFAAVIKDFFQWCGENPVLISWSNNDFGVLEKNLAKAGLSFPDGTVSYDLQAAYAYLVEKSIRNYSLKTAVEALQLPAPEDQIFHDAYYDALYTASIGRKLLQLHSILPSTAELEAFRATQCKPKKEKIPLKYSVKKSIYAPQHRIFSCPICGNPLHIRSWLVLDDCHFITKVPCECCNDYYPELFCDHFRQNKCDAHFTIWGAGHTQSILLYQKAAEGEKEITLFPYRGRSDRSNLAEEKSE